MKPNKIIYALSLLFGLSAVAASAVFASGPKDGSLFDGGPCKTCKKNNDKDGSLFYSGPCEKCKKENARCKFKSCNYC